MQETIILAFHLFLVSPAFVGAAENSETLFVRQLASETERISTRAGDLKNRESELLGFGYVPKVVVILETELTYEWAGRTPSKYDGRMIIEGLPSDAQDPPKRERELFARLQQAFNEMPRKPLEVVWDGLLPQVPAGADSPASRELAEAYANARFPTVLGTESSLGIPMDPRIYADGPLRYQGHILTEFDDGDLSRFVPITISVPNTNFPGEDPLSVAAAAAALASQFHLSKPEALERARELALKVSSERPAESTIFGPDPPSSSQKFKGIKLDRMRFPGLLEIGMENVLSRDPRTMEMLEGAIVVVGDAVDDSGIIFKDGPILPKTYLHAWTILEMLQSKATR